MHRFFIMRGRKRLPGSLAALVGIGVTVVQTGQALAQANTLGTMATTSTADLVDTSAWGSLLLFLLGLGFLVGGIYHAVMHRNGRSTVPLVGVALMVLLSGAAFGGSYIAAAAARSVTGGAPSMTQQTAVQPFAVGQ